jgi:hypothetical protein
MPSRSGNSIENKPKYPSMSRELRPRKCLGFLFMEIKKYKIYKITFPNGEHYIGRTETHEYMRWGSHLSDCRRGKHANKRMQEIYNEYGYDEWKFEVLKVEESDDSSYISLLEEQYIRETPNTINVYILSIDSKKSFQRYYNENKEREKQRRLEYYHKNK